MTDVNKILVVVDPSKDSHPALDRIDHIYSNASEADADNTEVIILILANQEAMDASHSKSYISRDYQWFVNTFGDIDDDDRVSVLTAWGSDWAEVIVDVVEEHDVSLSLVPFYGEVRDHLLSDERWKLLRMSKKPVMLVTHGRGSNNRVLAAVKTQDPEYDTLNNEVLEHGQMISEVLGADLHVVNAYTDSMDYPDRAKIASQAGIDNDHVYVKVGEPDEVICEIAKEVGADVVMIASQRRKGLYARFRGNTVEKIVGKLDTNILMI